MSITTTAHLNFRGNAREALEFYHSVFGGEIMVITYGDFGMPKELPDASKAVWGQVTADALKSDAARLFRILDLHPAVNVSPEAASAMSGLNPQETDTS
jgi:uncharacterized glyoxalase superfamily protein PhnB